MAIVGNYTYRGIPVSDAYVVCSELRIGAENQIFASFNVYASKDWFDKGMQPLEGIPTVNFFWNKTENADPIDAAEKLAIVPPSLFAGFTQVDSEQIVVPSE